MPLYPIAANMRKVALITGAALRLGRQTALYLAANGFSVVIHYRKSEEAAHTLQKDIENSGGKASLVQADLSKEEDVLELAEKSRSFYGNLGVLVNNASAFFRDEWQDMTRELWDTHLESNLRAPCVLMQEFARHHDKSQQGAIINFLDQRVWSITPHFMSYTVSKYALWGLTQSMALALAPQNIRVNAIGPGPTQASIYQTEEQFLKQCRSVPLRRGTDLSEIGHAVMSLISLPSVTGQMLALDGGQHLQWQPGNGDEI
ncbi:SDR family oxidoreductase [Entomobacter blattae]|uniref:SDR family oxidoreductase n=1 Tax=Entomobacter blattae TaxID=2762277 RepID=UPI00193B5BE0|nr:SDR family oxidoreductase [Entomobacter blattae]